MTLTTLPDDTLKLILCYVGDAATLRNVEKTCHHLKTAVEDDTVWAVPPSIVMLVNGVPQESGGWAEDTRFASNRERACVSKNLLALCLEQECTSNILIEELGTDGYTLLAELLFCEYNERDKGIHLREDTLETLAELVQHGIVLQLQRSLTLVACGEGSGYPTVTLTSIEKQAELAGMLECLPSRRLQALDPGRVNWWVENVNWVNEQLIDVGIIGTLTRDRVIRRLSCRAGIPKMANNAYTFVWEMILHLTLNILLPACLQCEEFSQSYSKARDEAQEFEELNSCKKPKAKTKAQSWQMTRYVQPNLCVMTKDYDDGDSVDYVAITPVPGKLEESSARLSVELKVYSALGDPSSIADVQENYELTEDIMAIEYEDDGSDSGFVDHCDDDEESDFSVYSDTEEDMMSTSDDLDEALEAFPRLFQD